MLTFSRAGVDAGRELRFRGSLVTVWLSGKGSHSRGFNPGIKVQS